MTLTWRAREKSLAASSWPSSWQVLEREERNMWYLGDNRIKREGQERDGGQSGVGAGPSMSKGVICLEVSSRTDMLEQEQGKDLQKKKQYQDNTNNELRNIC